MDELLPLIPCGATYISHNLSIINEAQRWTYFHGGLPVFSHDYNDKKAFRLISSSFILEGVCRNIDIENAFGVSKSSVIRNCNKLRNEGPDAFYKPKKHGSKGVVLTPQKIKDAEDLFEQGYITSEVASKINVKHPTLSKAILQGRVKKKVYLQKINPKEAL
jgi:DNA invertase Pin-like site-specific DNA recombinase